MDGVKIFVFFDEPYLKVKFKSRIDLFSVKI